MCPTTSSPQPLSDANFKKGFNRIYDWNLARSLNRIYSKVAPIDTIDWALIFDLWLPLIGFWKFGFDLRLDLRMCEPACAICCRQAEMLGPRMQWAEWGLPAFAHACALITWALPPLFPACSTTTCLRRRRRQPAAGVSVAPSCCAALRCAAGPHHLRCMAAPVWLCCFAWRGVPPLTSMGPTQQGAAAGEDASRSPPLPPCIHCLQPTSRMWRYVPGRSASLTTPSPASPLAGPAVSAAEPGRCMASSVAEHNAYACAIARTAFGCGIALRSSVRRSAAQHINAAQHAKRQPAWLC